MSKIALRHTQLWIKQKEVVHNWRPSKNWNLQTSTPTSFFTKISNSNFMMDVIFTNLFYKFFLKYPKETTFTIQWLSIECGCHWNSLKHIFLIMIHVRPFADIKEKYNHGKWLSARDKNQHIEKFCVRLCILNNDKSLLTSDFRSIKK